MPAMSRDSPSMLHCSPPSNSCSRCQSDVVVDVRLAEARRALIPSLGDGFRVKGGVNMRDMMDDLAQSMDLDSNLGSDAQERRR